MQRIMGCIGGCPQRVINRIPHSEHFSSAFFGESRPYRLVFLVEGGGESPDASALGKVAAGGITKGVIVSALER